MNKKTVGAFICGVVLTVVLHWPIGLFAQGPTGFTKLNSAPIVTTSYVDNTVTQGSTYQFSVTATNAAGESLASAIVVGTIPNTSGAHAATLTWTTDAGATGYNAYRFLVVVPAQVQGLGVATN